jgi:hypothetical protein
MAIFNANAPFSTWIDRARAVRIEDELTRRGIKLVVPWSVSVRCPKCGGDDRFSINTKQQAFNCCGRGIRGGGYR